MLQDLLQIGAHWVMYCVILDRDISASKTFGYMIARNETLLNLICSRISISQSIRGRYKKRDTPWSFRGIVNRSSAFFRVQIHGECFARYLSYDSKSRFHIPTARLRVLFLRTNEKVPTTLCNFKSIWKTMIDWQTGNDHGNSFIGLLQPNNNIYTTTPP